MSIVYFVEADEDIEGGASEGAVPHSRFGCGPIVKVKTAPFRISFQLNHGLSHGFPFNVADWIYIFSGELWRATITSVWPLPIIMLTFLKMGLPKM